jgi:hypothetical protein
MLARREMKESGAKQRSKKIISDKFTFSPYRPVEKGM